MVLLFSEIFLFGKYTRKSGRLQIILSANFSKGSKRVLIGTLEEENIPKYCFNSTGVMEWLAMECIKLKRARCSSESIIKCILLFTNKLKMCK